MLPQEILKNETLLLIPFMAEADPWLAEQCIQFLTVYSFLENRQPYMYSKLAIKILA